LIGDHIAKVTILQDIPDDDIEETAASIAYDQGVFHEISTYWDIGNATVQGGGHNSGFSPEDIVSDYLGARIAQRALGSAAIFDLTFDAAVTKDIQTVMRLLDTRTKAETHAAFQAIKQQGWVTDPNSDAEANTDGYLKRRNFNISTMKPCYVSAPGIGCTGTPAFPIEIATGFTTRVTDRYSIEFSTDFESAGARAKLGSSVKRSEFTTVVEAIRQDAKIRYPGITTECP
jgi:hypothetical protein